MASEWQEHTVESIKAPEPNALATGPFGSAISSKYFVSSGVPVIRGSNLSQDVGIRLIDNGFVFISPEKAKEFHRSIAKKGDLIFTCWGTIDQVGLSDERSRYAEYVVSNKQMKFTPDLRMANSLFLYYLFSTMQAQIIGHGIGSSVPGFDLGQLRSMKLRLPPLPEQQAVTRILGALDNKIELNRKMSETLEAMARTLFKSWFVDFDPVRAKSEGRPTGLPDDIAALFPDSFEDSELGEIPRKWKVSKIETLADVASGKRPNKRSSESTEDSFVPLWGGNGPMGFVAEPLFDRPIILTGRVGTLGAVFRISSQCWPSDNTLVLSARMPMQYEFLFFQLRRIDYRSLNRGSTQPLLTQTDLKAQPLVMPSPEPLRKFHEISSELFARINALEKESELLKSLRDTLLPKLISGELRVEQADPMVEAPQ